jgi:YhcH/YjgK/YiaL family protein
MIIDNIDRAKNYMDLGEGFGPALQFLYEHRDGNLAEGRYEISETDYALVQAYQTKPIESCQFEAHKKYIDIQYMVSGSENIGWALTKKLTEVSFDEHKDYVKLTGKGDLFPLSEGNFFILFPDDAHQPGILVGESRAVKKIVLKIRKK